MYEMVDKVVDIMDGAYPELRKNLKHIKKVVKIEEEKFSNTLDQGIQLVMNEIEGVKLKGGTKLSGDVTFKLYDTYGFPYELTEEICEENGIEVSKDEFLEKMEEQREKARSARTVIMEKGQDNFIEEFYDRHGKTEFTGYCDLMTPATLLSARELENGPSPFHCGAPLSAALR